MPRISSNDTVRVVGLDDLRRELKRLDDAGLTEELKDANFEVASKVVGWAQSRAGLLGRMDARAASTLTASRAQARAQVSFGGAKAPWAGGSEFGAFQNQARQTARGVVTGWNQFRPWTGNDEGAGYWLFPSVRGHTDEVVDTYGNAIDRITAKAFPN